MYAADDEMLLNDAQITEDPRERPRVATSLDLNKPDQKNWDYCTIV
jgi:hypothetical protein